MRALASHNSNFTLFYHSKMPLYHYTIPFYNTSSIPNFYFPILLIKIIYLHYKIIFIRNKIIYPQSPSFILSFSFFPFNNHKFYRKHRHHMPNVDHQTPHQSPKKKNPRPSNTDHRSPKHHMPNVDHQTPHRSPQKKTQTIKHQTPITQTPHAQRRSPNTTPITDHPKKNPDHQTSNTTAQRRSLKHHTDHRSPKKKKKPTCKNPQPNTDHPNTNHPRQSEPIANPQPNADLHTTPKPTPI